jgi:copper chaperone CopZ
MKNKIKSIALLSILFIAMSSFAAGHEKATIKTTGTCDMCKEKIEKTLMTVTGVKSAYFNLANGNVTVKYDGGKTNLDALRKSISVVGYDADDVKADHAAREALPKCCQSGSSCHH